MVSFGRRGQTAEVEAPQSAVHEPAPMDAPAASFPRVNLIPEQIAREVQVRRARGVLVVAAAASVAVVGGLYMMAAGEVSSAQEQLDSAQARSAQLAAEAAKYADVPKVQAELVAAQTQQVTALGGEVRWSTILNNLALTMPSGASLTSLKGTVSGQAPQVAAAQGAPSTGSSTSSVLGNPGIGTISYEGEALTNGRLAAFLEAISRNTGLIDPFATTAQAAQNSTAAAGSSAGTTSTQPKSITFAASATVSSKALSHRYDVKGS